MLPSVFPTNKFYIPWLVFIHVPNRNVTVNLFYDSGLAISLRWLKDMFFFFAICTSDACLTCAVISSSNNLTIFVTLRL